MALQLKVLPIVLLVAFSACSKSSGTPTGPTPVPTPTITRIITVSGNLAFGDIDVGTSLTRTFTISNTGNTAMSITGIQAVGGTGISGWQTSAVAGLVPAGGSVPATLQFSPTTTQFYNAVLTVVGDQTSGNAAINISGSGVNSAPLFRMSGVGDAVFDLPRNVERVHIVATYVGVGANFVATLGPAATACAIDLGPGCKWLADELMGTAFDETAFDAIVSTSGGGQVVIANSADVQWSFTEVR